ncbi:MAG TPA: peptidoglycan-binding domain-containing protein [Frankiaceae bacterium]
MADLVAPGATVQPVANTAGDRMAAQLGLVLHVQEGNGLPGLLATFNDPARQASATWWVGKDGRLVQLCADARTRMWAQAAGNETYCSVETEGFTTEPLTDAQIATLGRLVAWGHATPEFRWPLQLAEWPGQKGLGFHAMGGASWGGHSCPGQIRRGQRAAILAAASGTPTPVPAPAHHLGDLPLAVDGDFGPETVAATQRATGAGVDGIWGPDSKRHLQAHLGVAVDGDIGPITVRALQTRVGASIDGIWGHDTTSHLQAALNARRF